MSERLVGALFGIGLLALLAFVPAMVAAIEDQPRAPRPSSPTPPPREPPPTEADREELPSGPSGARVASPSGTAPLDPGRSIYGPQLTEQRELRFGQRGRAQGLTLRALPPRSRSRAATFSRFGQPATPLVAAPGARFVVIRVAYSFARPPDEFHQLCSNTGFALLDPRGFNWGQVPAQDSLRGNERACAEGRPAQRGSARLVFHVPADMRVERLVAWDDSVSTGPASYERNVAFVR